MVLSRRSRWCGSSRLRYHPDPKLILYEPKSGHDFDDDGVVDPLEFLARVLLHIPQPNKHLVPFYGAYATACAPPTRPRVPLHPVKQRGPVLPRRALSKRWADLIFHIYQVVPLTCTRCGAPMKILAFITEASVIKRVLDHLDRKTSRPRAPTTPDETFVH